MEIGERYQADHRTFNSIRDDAKRMVDQIADAKIDFLERVTNVWMKISRGDIADRFDKIKQTYLDVTKRPRTRSSARASSSTPIATSAVRSSRPR